MATKFCFGEEEATNEHATNEHEEEVKMLFAEMDMCLKEIEKEEEEEREAEKKKEEEEEAEFQALLEEEGTTYEEAMAEFRAKIQSVFDSSDEEEK